MKTDLISVIVPIYNVEKYLSKCIDSIISQTYTNLEIILVDDGSTDDSKTIAEKYLEKDKRIKLYHKENGGLSDARNYGIKEMTGKYVTFVDSDDYIETDIIEKMYNSLKTNNADICCCAKVLEYPQNSLVINNEKECVITSKEAIGKMFLKDDIDNSVCDKLFDVSLIKDITFPVGKYYEDIATTYKFFLNAKKICHICDLGYHYFMREGSISKEKFSPKQFDFVKYSYQMCEDCKKIYVDISEEAESFYYLSLITTMRSMKRSENFKEYKKEYALLKKEYNTKILKILKNRYIPFHKKVMAVFAFLNLYKAIEIIYNRISPKK